MRAESDRSIFRTQGNIARASCATAATVVNQGDDDRPGEAKNQGENVA